MAGRPKVDYETCRVVRMRYDLNGCGAVFPWEDGDKSCPNCGKEFTADLGFRVGDFAGQYEWYSCADSLPKEVRSRI